MDHTIVHFEIPADQPERAAQFYRDLFGWEISKWEGSADQRDGFEYWTVRTVPTDEKGMPTRPGVNGGLMRRMFPGQAPVNYVVVENVDDYVRRAQKLGAKLMMEKTPVPSMGWFAQLTDPEGNVFAVWETDSNAGQAAAAASGESRNAGR
ncbi:MAG TPA: VOC family protein [Gemmatimonadales bacterium]|nr:VOC family protein [Gemmatimonadales bacterium]